MKFGCARKNLNDTDIFTVYTPMAGVKLNTLNRRPPSEGFWVHDSIGVTSAHTNNISQQKQAAKNVAPKPGHNYSLSRCQGSATDVAGLYQVVADEGLL